APQSPRLAEGHGGRPLDKCLVQLRADAIRGSPRCSQERSGQQQSGYNASEGEKTSTVRGAPVDIRGHIRVRPGCQPGICLSFLLGTTGITRILAELAAKVAFSQSS